MAVRLAIPAVGAAHRRLNHALAVFGWSQANKTPVADMRRLDIDTRRRRSHVSGMACDGLADERSKVLIRDVH